MTGWVRRIVIAAVVFGASASGGDRIGVAEAASAIAPAWSSAAFERPTDGSVTLAYDRVRAYVVSEKTLSALDIVTGRVRWRFSGAAQVVAANGVVYVLTPDPHGAKMVRLPSGEVVQTPPGVPFLPDVLVALDARNGTTLWRRPGAGKLIAADDAGVVVVGERVVVAFARNGARRWHTATNGREHRVVVTRTHVVTLSTRDGATINGQLDSFERSSGRYIGTRAFFGTLLDLTDRHAVGVSDFLPDYQAMCGMAPVLDVSLDRGQSEGYPTLASTTSSEDDVTYALYSAGAADCRPQRQHGGYADVVVADGEPIVLANGPVIGFFDRSNTGRPFARFDDIHYVGGPFQHHWYGQRGKALVALNVAGYRVRITTLASSRSAFAVAGLNDRLYVANASEVTALDASSLQRVARYELVCPQMSALTHVAELDIVVCATDARGQLERLVALPAK